MSARLVTRWSDVDKKSLEIIFALRRSEIATVSHGSIDYLFRAVIKLKFDQIVSMYFAFVTESNNGRA